MVRSVRLVLLAVVVLVLSSPAGAVADGHFEAPLSIESYGTFGGVEVLAARGRFVGTFGTLGYRVPYLLTFRADARDGVEVIFEPPHSADGPGARDLLLGPDFVFGRMKLAHASVGCDRSGHELDCAAAGGSGWTFLDSDQPGSRRVPARRRIRSRPLPRVRTPEWFEPSADHRARRGYGRQPLARHRDQRRDAAVAQRLRHLLGQDGLMSASDVFDDAGGLYVKALVASDRQDGCDAAGVGESRTGAQQPVTCFGRFNGQGFDWFAPRAPFGFGWVPEGVTVQAPDGEWWVASGADVYRFRPSASFAAIRTGVPARVYTTRDGLPGAQIFRMFADSRGGIWLSIISPSNGLLHLEPGSHTVRDMTKAGGLPAVADELPRAFGEDRAGNVWVGLNTGGARYRNGTFQFFGGKDGLSSGHVVGIQTDRAGRLWLASARGGLIHVEDVASDRPRFTAYTTAQGLSGNSIEAVTEDRYGRLYVATGRGIDQFDFESSRVRYFTTDDGLAPGTVTAARRDRTGALWFATHGWALTVRTCTTRAVAAARRAHYNPHRAGRARPMSALGETDVTLDDLLPGENQILIEFVALGFAPGERLRYQFRLEGADHEWGAPTLQRSVRYAGLAPGRYRFLVRALNSDGVPSAAPAAVAFVVLPPVWQRWWFVSLTALALGAVVLTLHRYRVARVLELERVRTRIATDLHDDIGANLTRIAILSEVARQDSGTCGWQIDVPLSSIAEIARESVGAMADIVWAISPERDTLQEVVRKMRAHAEEVFEARDIDLALDLPVGSPPITMDVNVRRDLYLIFKEAVTNAVRHSACTRVSIVFTVEGSRLSLSVADNGTGFDASEKPDGNGLASMQRRARRLGAALDIRTQASWGTTVTLTMPIPGVRWRGR